MMLPYGREFSDYRETVGTNVQRYKNFTNNLKIIHVYHIKNIVSFPCREMKCQNYHWKKEQAEHDANNCK